jgi:hypothetical protein
VTLPEQHQAFAGSTAVRRWLANTTDSSDPEELISRRLDVLAGFLKAAGKEPDELVEWCFLRKRDSGDKFVSTKRRAALNEQIEQYVLDCGWSGKDAVANGNLVRSFLIHNGVPIGGRTWTGG